MARINTRLAATAQPVRIALVGVPTVWTTILEANDFSVSDPNVDWPERDPVDDDRRIQPGYALILAPLMMHNTSGASCWVEVRTMTESGDEVNQLHIEIPSLDTYMHPAPGQQLLKLDLSTANGDRMQIRAQTAGVIHLTSAAAEGSAEQHQPAGV